MDPSPKNPWRFARSLKAWPLRASRGRNPAGAGPAASAASRLVETRPTSVRARGTMENSFAAQPANAMALGPLKSSSHRALAPSETTQDSKERSPETKNAVDL